MPFADYDSDSDAGSDYSVTNTQLAISDGPLEGDDGSNPLVSRMGGKVAWLPTASIPPASVASCLHCGNLMELLVQIFAPLDDSAFDRAVLVWGCARAACQKRGKGSIRAIRILAHNARWAAKLEKKRQRQEAKEQARKMREAEQKARRDEQDKAKKANPFASMGTVTKAPGGLGGALFGSAQPPANSDSSIQISPNDHTTKEAGSESEDEDEEDDEARMAEEMAVKASLADKRAKWEAADWSRDAPAYEPAEYLNTYAEPSSASQREDEASRNKKQMQKLKKEGLSGVEMKGWEAEKYESMVANNDDTFDRFVKRVGHNGKQVVRYEFGGVPLPFHSKGAAYHKLWPKKDVVRGATVVSGAAFSSDSAAGSNAIAHEFSLDAIPRCPRCNGPRTFEMQLMPNLVNMLRPSLLRRNDKDQEQSNKKSAAEAEAERRREIELALGRKLPATPDADGITRDDTTQTTEDAAAMPSASAPRTGLQWNTAMIFVCEGDCHKPSDGPDASSSWAEEVVEIQSEHEI